MWPTWPASIRRRNPVEKPPFDSFQCSFWSLAVQFHACHLCYLSVYLPAKVACRVQSCSVSSKVDYESLSDD